MKISNVDIEVFEGHSFLIGYGCDSQLWRCFGCGRTGPTLYGTYGFYII